MSTLRTMRQPGLPRRWGRFTSPESWHPAAKIFPILLDKEIVELADDIRQHGLQNPVVIHDNLLLDGRNRILACRKAGVEPTLVQWTPLNGISPVEWVISQNLKRRHLDQSQVAACAVKALGLLEAEAKAAQQEGRKRGGKTAGRGRPRQLSGNISGKLSKKARSRESRERVGRLFKVNPRYVQDAKLLAEQAPEVFDAVQSGRLRISTAKELLKLGPGMRTKILTEAIKAGKSKAVKIVRAAVQRERAAKIAGVGAVTVARRRAISPGSWWQLVRHRLYCGDTSEKTFRDTLPHAALAFADPPYGAGVDDWDGTFSWKHDYLSDVASVVAVTPGIASIFTFARLTTMPYRWSLATWIANSHARGATGFGNWIYTALFAAGSVHRNAQDFSRISIPLSDLAATGHEGRKPTEYIAWLLETFTKTGDVVIDPFGGSGTTLLVAERLGRTCVTGESNPDFCAEIIGRWESDTKGRAEPVN